MASNGRPGDGAQPLLRVSALRRRFGEHEVLHGLSFEVRPGEAVAVVGPNGSGKSTLLQCVMGIQRPDTGSVTLHGRPLVESDPAVRAEIAAVDDSVDFFRTCPPPSTWACWPPCTTCRKRTRWWARCSTRSG